MTHAGDKKCSSPHCTNTYVAHRWGSIRAYNEGWFLQKDGSVWCPDHLPEWLAAWRAKQINPETSSDFYSI